MAVIMQCLHVDAAWRSHSALERCKISEAAPYHMRFVGLTADCSHEAYLFPSNFFYPSHPAIQYHNADHWSNVPACRMLAQGGRSSAMPPPFLSTGDRHHRGWEPRACDGARIQERKKVETSSTCEPCTPLPGANEVLAPKHGSTSRHLHFPLC